MKVLVVDDDAIQRMLLADMLQGFEKVDIVESGDGDAAWKEMENGLCPVLCCCDMRMPGISGIELLERFKSRPALADVPFIFFTAATDRRTIEDAIAAGATNYILKPFDLRGARSCLEKVFRGIRDRYCEDASATQKRLGIPPDKLLGYFAVFEQQLADAIPVMREHLANGGLLPALGKLENLQANCATLGLWHAVTMIEYAHSLNADVVERILRDVETIVDEQVLRAKSQFGMHETRSAKVAETPAQNKT